MAANRLKRGLYEYKGKIGFLIYQTEHYGQFAELYNESGEEYCCDGEGLRHPAAGWKAKKTSVRRLDDSEITKAMKAL